MKKLDSKCNGNECGEGTLGKFRNLSIILAGIFSAIGVSLLYTYIALYDVAILTKILWAGILSVILGVIFLVLWIIISDILKLKDIDEGEQIEQPPRKL